MPFFSWLRSQPAKTRTKIHPSKDFIGRWEETASTPPDDEEFEDCDSHKEEIEISETEISYITTCDGSTVTFDASYTFDNKKTVTLTLFGIETKSVIVELTGTTLKIENYYSGTKVETITYKKV